MAAAAARKSKKTKPIYSPAFAMDKPLARLSLYALKIAIGLTGKRFSPSKPILKTMQPQKNSSRRVPATPISPVRKSSIFTTHATFWSALPPAKPQLALRPERSLSNYYAHSARKSPATPFRSAILASIVLRPGNEIEAISNDLESPLRCVDSAAQEKMKAEVDAVLKAGDTVGGVFEVVAHNVPVGLGSHAQWDEKLDGKLAQAVMSVQAVKGVEIGAGILAAGSLGSEVQDEILYDKAAKKFSRTSNRAGGLEGGITNGEDIVVRGYLKPISTLASRS